MHLCCWIQSISYTGAICTILWGKWAEDLQVDGSPGASLWTHVSPLPSQTFWRPTTFASLPALEEGASVVQCKISIVLNTRTYNDAWIRCASRHNVSILPTISNLSQCLGKPFEIMLQPTVFHFNCTLHLKLLYSLFWYYAIETCYYKTIRHFGEERSLLLFVPSR